MRKADSQYWWTLGEHRADCKPLVLRTAFHGLEEGTVSALTKLAAALTLRRNLPERHVYDQLSRHAAKQGKLRLVEKLGSWQKEQDQACSFRRTGAQDMDVRSPPRRSWHPWSQKLQYKMDMAAYFADKQSDRNNQITAHNAQLIQAYKVEQAKSMLGHPDFFFFFLFFGLQGNCPFSVR